MVDTNDNVTDSTEQRIETKIVHRTDSEWFDWTDDLDDPTWSLEDKND